MRFRFAAERCPRCHTGAMEKVNTLTPWRTRLFFIGGGAASLVWAITLYWSLVANRYLDTPWTL